MRRFPSIAVATPSFIPSTSPEHHALIMENSLTAEIIQEIGSLPQILTYDFMNHTNVTSFTLNPGVSTWYTQNKLNYSHSFSLQGVSNPNISDIESGLLDLVAGRTFTAEEINQGAEVAVVSLPFARANNLSIGSFFQVYDIMFDFPAFVGQLFARVRHLEEYWINHQALEFEVVGIFDLEIPENTEGLDMHMRGEREFILTSFYVPFEVVKQSHVFRWEALGPIWEEWVEMGYFNLIDLIEFHPDAIFILESPRDFESFLEQAIPLLPDYWQMVENSNLTSGISDSLEVMANLADLTLWLSIGGLSLILTLVIWLFLYDRREEMGIYRALGAPKKSIFAQIAVELGTVFLPAVVFSLFIGNWVAERISHHLMVANLAQDFGRFTNDAGEVWTSRQSELINAIWVSSREGLAVFDISFDWVTGLLAVGMGIVIVLFALGVCLFAVLRISPKDILMGSGSGRNGS